MKTNIQEIWKDVAGYEGVYEISNLGRVRSIRQSKKRIIRQYINKYYRVRLYDKKCIKFKSIHRLIAIAFIPQVPGKPCINHKDGNKLNNEISNLEWCTHKENTNHAFKIGLFGSRKGEKNANSILSDEQVCRIRRAWDTRRASRRDLARIYGVSLTAIDFIINERSWKHI